MKVIDRTKRTVENLETEINQLTAAYHRKARELQEEPDEAVNSKGFSENAFLLLEIDEIEASVANIPRVKFEFTYEGEKQETEFIDLNQEIVTFDVKL